MDKDDARSKIILNKIASGAAHEQSDEQFFKDTDELYAMFRAIFDETKWNVEVLFKRMCRHTVEIAEKAVASFETGRMYMPQYIMLPDEITKYGTRHNMFLQLLTEGLVLKNPVQEHTRYRERLAEEIYIIESTNNVDYFPYTMGHGTRGTTKKYHNWYWTRFCRWFIGFLSVRNYFTRPIAV